MLNDLILYLTVLFFAFIGYWTIPVNYPAIRQFFLLVVSGLFVFAITPYGFLLALGMVGVAIIAIVGTRHYSPVLMKGLGIAGVIAVLAGSRIYMDIGDVGPSLVNYGLAFLTLRLISTIVVAVNSSPTIGQTLLQSFFFPIYAAGPIQPVDTFAKEGLTSQFDLSDFYWGGHRILVGLFKVSFVSQFLIKESMDTYFFNFWVDGNEFGVGESYAFILLSFMHLYMNFSGYTDVAIGSGRLFSIKIMENFNYPLLSASIQDFWRRWHLSLGHFVFNIPFLALARATGGKVNLTIFVLFVCIGLWHEFSVNYLLWGCGHGAALVICSLFSRYSHRIPSIEIIRRSVFWKLLGWSMTISYVAFLSAFANAPDIGSGFMLGSRLLGTG